MLRASLRILLAGLVGVLTVFSLSAQTFTRTSEIPPLRLSYDNLADILRRMHQIIATSNTSFSAPPYEIADESLDISDKQSDVAFQKDMTAATLALSAPEVSDTVFYYYHYVGAPISHVELRLGDYSRELVVGGQSKTDVDALSNLMTSDFNRYVASFAGASFRSTGGMLLTILIVVLTVIIIAIRLNEKIRVAILSFEVIIVIALYFLPWAAWLPGTAVYAGDASWVVRHQAGVTFVGTLASIIGIAAVIARGILNQLRPISDERIKEDPASEG